MASHLSHDEFFGKLKDLFEEQQSKGHGSVHITQTRMTHGHPVDTLSPYALVVRATNGKSKRSDTKKLKVSTIVQPHEQETFFTRHAELCKAGMSALKPRDRSKKKAKAKKKKVTGN